METHQLRQKRARGLLVFSLVLFSAVYALGWVTTAISPHITLGWSLVTAFIKSYLLIVGLYFCFQLEATPRDEAETSTPPLVYSLQSVLNVLQKLFLTLIILQITMHLYELWNELKLYPLELGFWESVWTLLRYTIGLLGTWVLELWFWIGKQLRISFMLNNPCLGGICLDEYPWVSLILASMLGYILKQLWKVSLIRFTARFLFQIVYGIARTVIKFVLRKLSRKATAHLSSSLLLRVGKETLSQVHSFYQLPSSEAEQESEQALE